MFLDQTENQKISYNYSKFLFSNFLNEIVHNTKPILRKGQIITYTANNEDVKVFLDKKIIEIIFRNILYNAIKYSYEKSKIEVKFHINSYIKVTIIDEGIGIPKQDQKHVFERFFRAKNAIHFQGTGIGLNIVKHHIEKFGGTIQFKSKENVGTTFTVKLPLKASIN